MSLFTPLPKEFARTNKEENCLMIKPCSRFNFFHHNSDDLKSAVTYLKLRSKSCDKINARNFCAKPLCRVDSTRVIDGPSKQRILQVRDHSSLTINGWQFSKLKYNMGNNYFTGIEDFLHVDNYYDKLIEKNFKENEDKIKGDFKAKIRNLQNFYEEMNKKYDFQHLTKTDLHKKLKEINSINKARRRLSHKKEEPFIPLGGIKIRQLLRENLESNKENQQETLIKTLGAFPDLDLSKIVQENKLIEPNDSKIEENISESVDSLEHNHDSDCTPRSPLFKTDAEKLKNRIKMFKTLEYQNKFIEDINNGTFLPNYQNKTQKIKSQKNYDSNNLDIYSSKIKASILCREHLIPTKDLMAEEFNKANYMFSMNNEPKNYKTSPRHFKNLNKLQYIKMGLMKKNSKETLKNSVSKNFLGFTRTTGFEQGSSQDSRGFEREKNLQNYKIVVPKGMENEFLKDINDSLNFHEDLKNFTRSNIHFSNVRNTNKMVVDNRNLEKMKEEVNRIKIKMENKRKCFSSDDLRNIKGKREKKFFKSDKFYQTEKGDFRRNFIGNYSKAFAGKTDSGFKKKAASFHFKS